MPQVSNSPLTRCANTAITASREVPVTRRPVPSPVDILLILQRDELGLATISNAEKTSGSSQALGVEYVQKNYRLLIRIEDPYVVSNKRESRSDSKIGRTKVDLW